MSTKSITLRNAEARALVQAGRVTVRRAVKPDRHRPWIEDLLPAVRRWEPCGPDAGDWAGWWRMAVGEPKPYRIGGLDPGHVGCIPCPLGAPGDVRLVRETWGDITADHPLVPDGRKPAPGDRLVYLSDPADAAQWIPGHPGCGAFCWRSPAVQPLWACRMALRVETVRVERAGDGWEWCVTGVREEVPK